MKTTRFKNAATLSLIGMLIFFSSCSSQRSLTYFKDLPEDSAFQTAILKAHEPKIQIGDILTIRVSSLDPVTNSMFNAGGVESNISDITKINMDMAAPAVGKEGYMVDKDGQIDYPVVGKVKLAGKTRSEAQDIMYQEVGKYVKDPIVSLRYLNFRVTVIGEVNRPGTFTINDDHVSVLEALGLAGDMSVFGKRKNVLVIREENNKRSMYRLDMNKKEVFNSPYFFLHQNDVVYVEPIRSRDPNGERTLRIVSTIATVGTAISLIILRAF